MNRSRALFLALSLAVLIPLVSGVLWSATRAGASDDEDSLYKHLAIFSEVLGLVRSSYVDETDLSQLIVGAMDGSTDALDPLSVYLPAEAVAPYARTEAVGTAHSGIYALRSRGIAYVLTVEEGSPAAAAGFEAGDVLADIAGRSTRDMPAWQLESLLAGDPGTRLEIEILRRGDAERKTLELGTFPSAKPRLENAEEFPMLRLAKLDGDSVAAVRPLLEGLAASGTPKLLVDLRGVAGGSIEAAYAVGGLFAQGALGELHDREKTLATFEGKHAPVWRGEIVVLVDSSTLGAAEVLASILRGAAAAKLVGVPTFGWAGVRSPVDLEGGAKLLLTTAFYRGPDGEPISKALAPDVLVDELSISFGERELTLRDLILDRGIRVLRGEQESAEPRAA